MSSEEMADFGTTDIRDDHRVIWKVAEKVRGYMGGSVGWIALQETSEPGEWWGFVIHGRFGMNNTGGFACIEIEQARNADDALIRELAAQVLGYPVDSESDLRRRLAEADQHLRDSEEAISKLMREQGHWISVKREIKVKLSELATDNTPGA